MSLAISKATPLNTAAIKAESQKLIGTWNIQGKKLLLFLRKERFAFSVDGTKEQTFESKLYDTGYALNLISMFHRTIGINLANDKPNSACFLPKLCALSDAEPDIAVALFGRVDVMTDPPTCKGMRWGLYNTTSQQEQTVEISLDDAVEKRFLLQAPNGNYSSLDTRRDKEGKEIVRPKADHYAMTSYAKHFSITFKRDQMHRIQEVALHCVSLLDRTVRLSENIWAVTLVSKINSTETLGPIFRGAIGHAMLACEGINQEGPFLRYLHLTQGPREQNPDLRDDEAQIEAFDKKIPYCDTLNGPTWTRSRHLVENMFMFMDQMHKVPLKFALYGTSIWTSRYSISLIQKATGSPTASDKKYKFTNWKKPGDVSMDRLRKVIHEKIDFHKLGLSSVLQAPPQLRSVPMTCYDWACVIARKGGIILYEKPERVIPLTKIKKLQNGNIVTLPMGEPSLLLEKAELQAQMTSATALLTHTNSSIEECDEWARAWVIENIKTMGFNNLSAVINAWAIKFPISESKED